jgi:hypothetical protein
VSCSNQLVNTETELVAGAKEDEAIAFEELVELHERKHRRLALRITHSPEDAEDAVQGSLLQAFVHLRSFRGDSPILHVATLECKGLDSGTCRSKDLSSKSAEEAMNGKYA